MRVALEAGWLDLDAGLYVAGGRAEALRPMETRLLRYLAERAGSAVHQDELLERVWGYSPRVRSRTVRVTVGRIRRRIEADPKEPRHLVTRPGEGYALCPAAEEQARARSGLVGRTADLRAIADALRRFSCVVMVGPGGVGKTALARVHAAGIVGGVWVDGRSARTVEELEELALATTGTSGDALVRMLSRAALVVVDDVERIDGVSVLLERWSVAGVRLLVTSRRQLTIDGAATFEVLPLDATAMAELLEQTWLRVAVNQDVDVAPLVPAMGGLPLAAELTSAWAPLLSPAELAQRLQRHALEDPARSDRHGSLSVVLEQSLQLLRPEELQALVVLATCPGGVGLEDAEALVEVRPLSCLLALRRHSLVHRTLTEDGRERLELLPPVREHVRRTQPSDDARRRQALHYGDRARDVVEQLHTPRAVEAWWWLVAEAANLRVALRHEAPDELQRWALIYGLDHLGRQRGPQAQHRLDLAFGERLTGDARAWWRVAVGRWTRNAGELEAAHELLVDAQEDAGVWASLAAVELARCQVFIGKTDDAWISARRALAVARDGIERSVALRGLAILHNAAGESDKAVALLSDAHELATSGSPEQLAETKSELAEVLAEVGERGAMEMFDEALAIQEAQGFEWGKAGTLSRKGGVMTHLHERLEVQRQCLAIAREFGNVRVELHAGWRLAQLAMEAGELELEGELTDAIEHARGVGDPNLVGILLLNRAHMRCDREAYAEADRDYEEARVCVAGTGMDLHMGTVMSMSGMGAACAGRRELAIERIEHALLLWKEQRPALPALHGLLGVLCGERSLVDPDDDLGPWFLWAFDGGPEPEWPSPEESWVVRQIRRGKICLPERHP